MSTRCRITELPDCLMESIISLLPLKDAMNTILASPAQWKHLTSRNLEFNNHSVFGNKYPLAYIEQESDRVLYVRRVNKFLQQYKGNKVDSFKIDCKHVTTMYLDEWIGFAIKKRVEELHVRVGWSLYRKDIDHDVVFPQDLLVGSTSNHLKRLSLEECILRHPTSALDVFNRLINLCLKEVVVYESVMENLFSVCVLLESLTFDRCDMSHNGSCLCGKGHIVAGDRLTHLKVKDSKQGTIVDISAPNLTSLEYHPHWNWKFSIKAPRLSRIVFSYKKPQRFLPHALIEFASCPKLETLDLQMPGELLDSSSIPTYGNLKQLHLDIDLDERFEQDYYRPSRPSPSVEYVQNLLKAAPLLEELTIRTRNTLGLYLSETNRYVTRNINYSRNDHLRMVKMRKFRGNWYETELAICILEDSPKLEKLVIHRHPKHFSGVVEEKLKGVKTDAQIIIL